MSKRHYGEVTERYEYNSLLGPAIEIKVEQKEYDAAYFDNAAWTLERFNPGDRVTWLTGFWRSIIDPRGTGSLQKVSELEKKAKELGKLVIVESPFAGDVEKNIEYGRKCMRDCFMRGEFPFASHLLYTQKGILDDTIKEERKLGIDAGLTWGKFASVSVVYTDLGITEGMKQGIERAKKDGRIVKMRTLK